MMEETRLQKQLRFLVEVDQMKNVLRQTLLVDKSRRENDAEHSWHFALMAMLLSEYADGSKVDFYRVLRMALVHDLIEVGRNLTRWKLRMHNMPHLSIVYSR